MAERLCLNLDSCRTVLGFSFLFCPIFLIGSLYLLVALLNSVLIKQLLWLVGRLISSSLGFHSFLSTHCFHQLVMQFWLVPFEWFVPSVTSRSILWFFAVVEKVALYLKSVKLCIRSLWPETSWMPVSSTPSLIPCRSCTAPSWRTSGSVSLLQFSLSVQSEILLQVVVFCCLFLASAKKDEWPSTGLRLQEEAKRKGTNRGGGAGLGQVHRV